MTSKIVYKSLDETLNYLNDPAIQTDEVKELLNLYEKTKLEYVPSNGERKNLLIVFEGLDGSGKTTLCNMVAKELNAVRLSTPPRSIQSLRPYFDKCRPPLRRAYYYLGNYMSGMTIEAHLANRNVVLDRFWYSTASHSLAESPLPIPPVGNLVYEWPKDLIKPDITIFLLVRENLRYLRIARRRLMTYEEQKIARDAEFRQRLHDAFSNMEGLSYVESNAPLIPVFQDIMENELNPLMIKLLSL